MELKTTNQDSSYQDQDINVIHEITDLHPSRQELTSPHPAIPTKTAILTPTTTTPTRATKIISQGKNIVSITKNRLHKNPGQESIHQIDNIQEESQE